MSICWGAIDFGLGTFIAFLVRSRLTSYSGYDLANQTAYLDEMLRWGLDWLMKVYTLQDLRSTDLSRFS